MTNIPLVIGASGIVTELPGDLNTNNHRIINLLTPVASSDGVNKYYSDKGNLYSFSNQLTSFTTTTINRVIYVCNINANGLTATILDMPDGSTIGFKNTGGKTFTLSSGSLIDDSGTYSLSKGIFVEIFRANSTWIVK